MSKPTVSLETARQLEEAGFVPPEVVEKWQLYWALEDLCLVGFTYQDGDIELIRPVMRDIEYTEDQFKRLATFAPTATDILAQFQGRLSRGMDGQWKCKFTVTQFYEDCYYDDCPHEACAKAYLAWKAGRD